MTTSTNANARPFLLALSLSFFLPSPAPHRPVVGNDQDQRVAFTVVATGGGGGPIQRSSHPFQDPLGGKYVCDRLARLYYGSKKLQKVCE